MANEAQSKADKSKEKVFVDKYMLGEKAGEYAIHGGGFLVRVRGVEGVVGFVVVSGLKPHKDHAVPVRGMLGVIKSLKHGKSSFWTLSLGFRWLLNLIHAALLRMLAFGAIPNNIQHLFAFGCHC